MPQKYYQFLILFCFFAFVHFATGAEPLYILYTANINGALENCGCGETPLGGIGKIKYLSESYKKNHNHVMLIDGGDFFNTYPYKELNDAMLKVYQGFDYDFVVPGDQIFIEGEEFYNKVLSSMKGRMIISNDHDNQKGSVKVKFGPYSVSFTAILSPKSFDYIEKPAGLNLIDPANYKIKQNSRQTLQIVVYHGYLDEARQFAQENKNINILFLAHDQERGIWKEGNVQIIANGKDSESISIVETKFDTSWKFEIIQQLISNDYPEAEDVLDIIDEFRSNPGQP